MSSGADVKPEESIAASPPPTVATENSNGQTGGVAATNGGGENRGKKGGRKQREEQVPIEELFDLSKPIPKVEKPDKEENDKVVNELADAVKALQDRRRVVQEKIDGGMDPDSATKGSIEEKRTELNNLKKKKSTLISEKKSMRTELDKMKNENEKILKDKKDARSNVKYSTIEEIDKEIKVLERKQETTSMSLPDEKKLIQEISALKASKKFVTDIKSKDAAIDDIKVQRKSLGEQITSKDKEIDSVTKDIERVTDEIKVLNDAESNKRGTMQDLFKERDALRKQIAEKLKEKDAVRDEFRKKNDDWYTYQRALRAQKKIQYEEEKAKRDAERAEYEAKLAAEELKKIPYEEEQALCEFLANYLERTYMGKEDESAGVAAKKEQPVAVQDDPFAGFKPVNKKSDDEYFGKGKAKKTRVRGSKKQDTATTFTLSVDTFEQFGMIQMDPPTKLEEVEASIKQLREKKEWYSQQPRGSVPTAQEIRNRKMNEKKAANRSGTANEGGLNDHPKSQQNSKKNFSLDKDDFVPLGSAAAPKTGVNSTWGQKTLTTTTSTPAVTEEPAPATTGENGAEASS